MQFRETQSIYLQIADYVCEKILLKEWLPGERIPSVRELAVQLEVNPNTIMKTYEFLQQENIIFNQRGIGFFAADDAITQATRYRRDWFIEKDLPQVFRSLFLLDMTPEELIPLYEKFKKQMRNKKADRQ
jgi:DNA-binding transcriptional regulator YhcF (GntR family)